MANAKPARPVKRAPRVNGRLTKKVCKLAGTAFARTLTDERVSVRNAARWCGVSPTTVQNWKRQGFLIGPLRSRRLAMPFLLNLLRLVSEAA